MAKSDWGELQQQFLFDHAKTGISPKAWCEAQGLKYESARRHIKNPTAQKTAQKSEKIAQKKLRTAQSENAQKRNGRTSDYLPEVAEDICNLLIEGESLRSICKRPGMPIIRKVMRWLEQNEEFRHQYAHARETQVDCLVDEVIAIADDCIPDSVEVAKAKLRIDARKWYATKVAPKKYGYRILPEEPGVSGHDQHEDLTDEQLDERLREFGHGRFKSQLDEKRADLGGVSETSD